MEDYGPAATMGHEDVGVWNRRIDPGGVFDLELPLEDVAEGYRAMDQRRAIKALLKALTAHHSVRDYRMLHHHLVYGVKEAHSRNCSG